MNCEVCKGRSGHAIVHAFGVNFYPCRERGCREESWMRAVLRLEAFRARFEWEREELARETAVAHEN